MKLNPNSYTDGTYWLWPGTIANGNPYYGGAIDVTASGGSAYLHPYDNTKPRNGWLRLAAWNPAQTEYDGSLTPAGSGYSLSDRPNGGAMGGGGYSGPSPMYGSFRTILEGIKWVNGQFVMTGAQRLCFRLNEAVLDVNAMKAQFDQVCTLRGVSTSSAPPNDSPNGPYYSAFQSDDWKRNNNWTWLRIQGAPAGGADRIMSLCNDIHGISKTNPMPNDGHFLGGCTNFRSRGDRLWWNYNSVNGAPWYGQLFFDMCHSDIVQMIGGESGLDILYLTAAACNDIEFSAEVNWLQNLTFGDYNNPQLIWIMGAMASPFLYGAINGNSIRNTALVGAQYYAGGQYVYYSGGPDSGYDTPVDTTDYAHGATNFGQYSFSHVKPPALRMSGAIAVDPVADLITAKVGPADDFRRTYSTPQALDTYMSTQGWFD